MATHAGKVAVITGAGRGIGRAVAVALARAGVHVVVSARTQSDLDALAAECEGYGVRALAFAADASQEADVTALRDAALGAFGHVDIVVNNAGVAKYGLLGAHTAADYDWMMNSNMRSTFLVTHAFLPGMLERRSGNIVIVSSQAGLRGFPTETVYCATKHAQVGFGQALDHEVRPHGVKVNVICPGGVNTTFAFGTGRTEGQPGLADMLDADDVAGAVMFALSQPPKSRVMLIEMRPTSEPWL